MNSRPESVVTVVSGLPRSGTSMMMQMLQAGGIPAVTDNIREADEDNLQGYFELESAKRMKQDASWLTEAAGKSVKVVYMLLYDLPMEFEYRIIFMNRDLDEVLASQQKMLERRGEQGASVSAEKLKSIFASQLVKVHDWLAGQPNFSVLDIDHRDVLSKPEEQARRISSFLGRELDLSAMVAVVNPTLYRQRSNT